MTRHTSKRSTARRAASRGTVVLLTLVGVGGMGVALAAWTTTGAGSATARAGAAQPLTTSAVAVTTNLLYPNGPAGDVRVTIDNPNPYAVRVTQITATGPATASGGIGSCATTGVTFTNQAGAWDVAANGSATVTLAGAATMSNASDNGCQNATFAIPVALSGASN